MTTLSINVSPTSPRPQADTIDYSDAYHLEGTTKVVSGITQTALHWPGITGAPSGYSWGNVKSGLDKRIRAANADPLLVPNGGRLLFDAEPWTIAAEHGAYEDNDEATNLILFGAYALTLWHYGQELRERLVNMRVYKSPVIVNYTAMGSSSSGTRRNWTNAQERMLWQAKHAGMLDALEACGGGVAIPLYLPNAWASAATWADNVERVITTTDEVLDAWGVEHVWLLQPEVNGAAIQQGHLDVIIPATMGRLAAWGGGSTKGFPELAAAINAYHAQG